MNSYIKAWITNFIFIQAFFIFNVYSEEIAHPTYSDFLEKFPDGYPKFIGTGNPKSIGAFKLYLEELGYLTFENDGNSIGFKYYVSGSIKNSSSIEKFTPETNGNLADNLTTNTQSEQFYNNDLKTVLSRDQYSQTVLISQWGENINNQINEEKNALSRAGLVEDGEGVMKVQAVGDKTKYGATLKELISAEDRLSPLQQKLAKLGKQITNFGYIGATLIALAFMFNHVFFDPLVVILESQQIR